MITIGIDPAAKSGLCVLDGHALLHSSTVNVRTIKDCIAALEPWKHADVIYIEGQWVGETKTKVGKAKAKGALKTSKQAARWEDAACLFDIPVKYIAVATWRSAIRIAKGDRDYVKDQAIDIATRRWGITQVDAAEAACIALAGYLHETQRRKP